MADEIDRAIPYPSIKKDVVLERLQRREEERLAKLEKKRSGTTDTQSLVAAFTTFFQQSKASLEALLEHTEQVKGNRTAMNDHFASMAKELQAMQQLLSDAVLYLPAYDVRTARETLQTLQEAMKTQQDEVMPRKKFAFSARKKDKDDVPDGAPAPPPTKRNPETSSTFPGIGAPLDECCFRDTTDQDLVKTDIDAKDVILQNLSRCKVRLPGSPATIHASALNECVVFTGPTVTSIVVDDCRRCTFVVACQQLRIHGTSDSDFYLYVTSRSIIEDCHGLRFAPYNWKYRGVEEDFQKSGLGRNVNNWNSVDDFNWLAADKVSPNWRTLPENERVQEWE